MNSKTKNMNSKTLIIAMLCPFFMFAQNHKMDKKLKYKR